MTLLRSTATPRIVAREYGRVAYPTGWSFEPINWLPGETLHMGDGQRWFHPYDGRPPIRLDRPGENANAG